MATFIKIADFVEDMPEKVHNLGADALTFSLSVTAPASESPDPTTTDQAEWRRYLYEKSNPAGWQTERWFHTAGCRCFLIVERNTMTNEIRAVRGANSEGETSS